jgi:hypothetical protein
MKTYYRVTIEFEKPESPFEGFLDVCSTGLWVDQKITDALVYPHGKDVARSYERLESLKPRVVEAVEVRR